MRVRRRIGICSVAAVATVGLVAVPGASASPRLDKVPVAKGSGGAVVSDTVQATQAGLDVLRRGGTAADAAVAVAATLGVTDPNMAGLGGGGYFVYYDAKSGKVSTIDGRETAPATADDKLFVNPATGQPYAFADAVTSGLSVGTPGNLALWERALQRWGKYDLDDALKPAIRVAEQGFPVTPQLRKEIEQNQDRFKQFSSTSALYLPGGAPPAVGSTLRNPDLARTYKEIARNGTRAFYGGSIGRDVANTAQNPPLAPGATITPPKGKLAVGDLRAYRPLDQAPTKVQYRDYDVYGMAPSSSGGTTVGESLNILEKFELANRDRTWALHYYLEATKLAYADRGRYVGDPKFVDVPTEALLSQSYADVRGCQIDPIRARPAPVAPGNPLSPGPCYPPPPSATPTAENEVHTNHFVVADARGNVVSYTNTLEQVGGSGIVVPGRGFLLNNQLTDFNFTPTQGAAPDPNLPAAGKRPRSSMSPTIVLKDGKPWLALGSPGGSTIITTVLQIILNRIDFKLDLPSAVAAPRASQRNTPTVTAEPAFIAAYPELGNFYRHQFTEQAEIGAAAALEFTGNGQITAAGEPVRRSGTSAGVVHPAR
ncbi:gamma-glutamyltransferase [Actinokineospora auranticolor]|uniref:Glutathione hydrolase proenzyme n=1 Tax=Actinokineospora auranticolor TaxID=155976 RepID=A0A2S6GHZ1_9PSEU|nr:gamma-glutamyltransferase [Actinokineospora auranticolor]PPK64766.1 gamma-glutamyltranspeptidase/glutathione hydrolase [Actinokineospora auranticolor]